MGYAPTTAPPLCSPRPLARCLRSSPCCRSAHRLPSCPAPSFSLRPQALAPPPPRPSLGGRHFSSRFLKFGGSGDRILLQGNARPLWRPRASWSHAEVRFLSFLPGCPRQFTVPGSGAPAPGSQPPPPPPGSKGKGSGGLGQFAAGPFRGVSGSCTGVA